MIHARADRSRTLWLDTSPETSFPRLDGDRETDVAIVGGGIVGIVTATLLREAGRRVTLLEARRVCEGVTGHTTAKLTSQHGLKYDSLISSFGEEKARLYAAAQQAAIAWVLERGIECDVERAPAYVWAETDDEVEQVRKEAEAAARLGLPAAFTTDVPAPIDALGAVRFDDQAQYNPCKFLVPLAEGLGGDVFEQTAVRRMRTGDVCRLETLHGTVRARHVVVATHIPFADRGGFFTRAFPHRGYVIAGPLEEAPTAMLINAGSPTRSVRSAIGRDGTRLLVVAGDGHPTGVDGDTRHRYDNLERWARERYGLQQVEYRWSTQDYYPVDEVPFVGPLTPRSRNVWTATGFGAWGMSNGVASAMVLVGRIVGGAHEWADVFDTQRTKPALKPGFYKDNALAVGRLVGDRLRLAGSDAVRALTPGEGVVVRDGIKAVAVSRAADGSLHAVSARCTHVGCLVRWNRGERSWDCPCHGSRFTPEGKLLDGPAVHPLEQVQLEPD